MGTGVIFPTNLPLPFSKRKFLNASILFPVSPATWNSNNYKFVISFFGKKEPQPFFLVSPAATASAVDSNYLRYCCLDCSCYRHCSSRQLWLQQQVVVADATSATVVAAAAVAATTVAVAIVELLLGKSDGRWQFRKKKRKSGLR